VLFGLLAWVWRRLTCKSQIRLLRLALVKMTMLLAHVGGEPSIELGYFLLCDFFHLLEIWIHGVSFPVNEKKALLAPWRSYLLLVPVDRL